RAVRGGARPPLWGRNARAGRPAASQSGGALGGALDQRADAEPQPGEPDEASSVRLLIAARLVEARQLRIVERPWRRTADRAYASLVEAQPRRARDRAGGIVDGGLEHRAFRREPVAVVHQLGVARRQRVA